MDERMKANIRAEMMETLSKLEEWPHWPRLPVKRYVKDDSRLSELETGIIIAVEGYLTTVFLDNLFNYDNKTGFLKADYIDNQGMKHIKYDDVDAMLNDGWMVD